LKGTILLAPEGINFFLAGTRERLAAVLAVIRAIPGLADVAPKESPSSEQPFKRMLVKVKKEIIAFGVEGVDPARRPAKKISARQLKAVARRGPAGDLARYSQRLRGADGDLQGGGGSGHLELP
jgi:predicted sulfurtransferase